MFYCDPCARLRRWPESWHRSQGRCETCGQTAVCNDVPFSELPPLMDICGRPYTLDRLRAEAVAAPTPDTRSDLTEGPPRVKNLSSTSWEQRYRQLTLGEVIARLELEDPGRRLADGFANPHSYRGYYDQLAFEPASAVLVDDMLGAARSALGSTYQGWKGGDYMMTADTDCWIAVEGLSAGGWITGVVLDTMLGESVKKRDLRRQLADANQRADGLAKAVNDALDSTLTDAARIAELEAELESMRKSWRPIPISHQWEPRDGRCRFCDDPRGHERHAGVHGLASTPHIPLLPPIDQFFPRNPAYAAPEVWEEIDEMKRVQAEGDPGPRTPAEEHAMEQLEREG
jgi:hypothetical protein